MYDVFVMMYVCVMCVMMYVCVCNVSVMICVCMCSVCMCVHQVVLRDFQTFNNA